ncbi:MAG: CBS domain-containing protein [Candidatus Methylomirabilales bacterium]
MRVEGWMQRKPVTISPQETLRAAWRLIREHRIRHLPVVEGGRLMGIVTDRDLRHALPSRAVSLEMHEIPQLAEKVRIWEVMARALVTIPREARIEEAARLLLRYRIGGLPVVKGETLVGIITKTDLVRALLHCQQGSRSRPTSRTKSRKSQRQSKKR